MGHSTELFQLGPLTITSTMTTMLAITLILSLVCFIGTRHMRLVPQGLQNVLEKAVEMLDGLISGILGAELSKKYFAILATLFIFIIISNYSGLLPLAGTLPGLAAPTASLSVTVGLATIVFCLTHYAGLRHNGLGYFKHFTKPYIFLLPLLLIEEFVRPLSLSLRLYGNVFGEETVTHQFFDILPLGLPLIMNALSLLMGGIQAFVFVLLACIYIQGAAEGGH